MFLFQIKNGNGLISPGNFQLLLAPPSEPLVPSSQPSGLTIDCDTNNSSQITYVTHTAPATPAFIGQPAVCMPHQANQGTGNNQPHQTNNHLGGAPTTVYSNQPVTQSTTLPTRSGMAGVTGTMVVPHSEPPQVTNDCKPPFYTGQVYSPPRSLLAPAILQLPVTDQNNLTDLANRKREDFTSTNCNSLLTQLANQNTRGCGQTTQLTNRHAESHEQSSLSPTTECSLSRIFSQDEDLPMEISTRMYHVLNESANRKVS